MNWRRSREGVGCLITSGGEKKAEEKAKAEENER